MSQVEPDVEVHAGPGPFHEAVLDGQVVGRAEVWARPDGRRFLHVHDDATRGARMGLLRTVPASVDGELHTWIRSGARRLRGALEEQDFAEARREDHLAIDVAGAQTWLQANPGPRATLAGLDDIGIDELRSLDEELRDDVPGCDGWRWDPAVFRAEMHSAGHDDALYRVAIEGDELLGLVRVWADRDAPRLGLVGVRRADRRRGLARTLLAAVVAELTERGVPTFVTEADPQNVPVRRLLDALGATVEHTMVEMVRPAAD